MREDYWVSTFIIGGILLSLTFLPDVIFSTTGLKLGGLNFSGVIVWFGLFALGTLSIITIVSLIGTTVVEKFGWYTPLEDRNEEDE